MRRLYLLLYLTVLAPAAFALSVVQLGWVNASEVAASLRPQLRAGESVTGLGGELVISASPARERELAAIARALDVKPVSLSIEVDTDSARRGSSASIDWGGSSLSSRSGGQNSAQTLTLLSGRSGEISLGQSRPVPWRWTHRGGMQQAISGFVVTPRLVGDTVNVQIAVSEQAFGRRDSVAGTRLLTQVSVPLGQWITLGQWQRQQNGQRVFLLGVSTAQEGSGGSVRLKVERAP